MQYEVLVLDQPFENDYVSVSRLKKYEQCPLAYGLWYIERLKGWHEKDAANLGKLVHLALEKIYRWAIDEEFSGDISEEVVLRIYRDAFAEAEDHIVGTSTYKEGLDMVRNYFCIHPAIDHMSIVSTEQPFKLTIESDDGKTVVMVHGYIDRVDRVGPSHIRIIDYKTNRFFFTREEIDTDLQMSVYGLVGKTLWPWAEKIDYGYDMLRHNIRQRGERTDEQLNEGADYVIALTKRIESQLEFKPNLNPLCAWCDLREHCAAYSRALEAGETTLRHAVAAQNIEQVSNERERASSLERIAKKRRQEMDRILLAHIAKQEDLDAIEVGDMRYKPVQSSDISYPFDKTVKTLSEALSVPTDFVTPRVSEITKGRIDLLVSQSNLSKGKRQLLNAKLKAIAERRYKSPWIKPTKVVARKA